MVSVTRVFGGVAVDLSSVTPKTVIQGSRTHTVNASDCRAQEADCRATAQAISDPQLSQRWLALAERWAMLATWDDGMTPRMVMPEDENRPVP